MIAPTIQTCCEITPDTAANASLDGRWAFEAFALNFRGANHLQCLRCRYNSCHGYYEVI